jgi:hypothetical protein
MSNDNWPVGETGAIAIGDDYEARQWADRFGMSPLARLRNRWLLPESGEAEASAERADATVIRLRPSG